jgi:hypothetical protein
MGPPSSGQKDPAIDLDGLMVAMVSTFKGSDLKMKK